MQMTPERFFQDAVDLSGSVNQSSLTRKLGVTTGAFSQWKKGRSYPSDKTMLKIALLCDLDPNEALALLNLWRCDESARSHYEATLQIILKAKGAALAVGFGVLLAANPLFSKEALAQVPNYVHLSDDYEKYHGVVIPTCVSKGFA